MFNLQFSIINMKTPVKIQYFIAVAAFMAAVGFGIAGFIVPPPGQVHDSVLYLIAQFLLLTASILGVGAMFASQKLSIKQSLEKKEL